MSNTPNNQNTPTDIGSVEEARMLSAYLDSGQRQFNEARATSPDTEAPQGDWDRFASGEGGEVKLLPAHTDLGSQAVGGFMAEQGQPGATVLPFHRK